jgi:hemerythrin-like domain-containing protein
MPRSNDHPPILDLRNRAGANCRTPDPIGLISEEHALQRELCDLLEAIADGLPHSFDKALAVIAVSILEGSVPRHMRLEEEALFPSLRDRVAADHPLHAALSCLEDEHERDGATLVELTDALKTAAAEGTVANPDMLGYMLRGYFEGQRRHIAWEDRVVLPVARQVLRPEDLAALQGWIMASDHPRCSQQSVIAIRNARSARGVCDGCPSAKPSDNILPFTFK